MKTNTFTGVLMEDSGRVERGTIILMVMDDSDNTLPFGSTVPIVFKPYLCYGGPSVQGTSRDLLFFSHRAEIP